jgi:hypothetical protein
VSRFTAKLFFSSAPAFTLERQASDLQPGAKWPVGRQYLGIVAAAHQPPTCFAAARLAQCSDLHRRWVNAWSRELNPDTKRNIGRRTFKREARRRLKNGAAENRLSLARSLLFYLSFDQPVLLRIWRVTTPGIQRLGLLSIRSCAIRRRRRRRGEGAHVFALARLRNDTSCKIRLGKSVLEKTLRVRVSSQNKFPRRVLNIRNVVHVRNALFSRASKMP